MIETLHNSHLDKLGYYEVNGHKHLHKITAYHHAGRNWEKVKFNFNDDIFGAYDWTKEPRPNVPLVEFYKERALQLREKYEYLVVMFSGGPDSMNMMNAFIDNDIFVDEIVCIHSYDRTKIHAGTVNNADWVFNAKPTLDKWTKENNLKSKITIIDEIELTKNYLDSLEFGGQYEMAFGSTGWASHIIFKGTWIRYVPHLWKMIIDGHKVGLIVGSEKPNINVDENNRYYTNWFDLTLVDAAFALSEDPVLKHIELKEYFYHSPDFIDLIAKQLHVLKNFMDKNHHEQLYYIPSEGTRPTHSCWSKHTKKNLIYMAYHKIIYPKWNPAIITPKTKALVNGRVEDCWWLPKLGSENIKFWIQCYDKIAEFRRYMPWLFSRRLYID